MSCPDLTILVPGCKQGKIGSTVNVSLLGCQLACEAADTCTSIAYNAVLEQCFLKSGQTLQVCTVRHNHSISAQHGSGVQMKCRQHCALSSTAN